MKKELDYLGLDAHLIIGRSSVDLINTIIRLHNRDVKVLGEKFDGWVKSPLEALSLLSGLGIGTIKKYLPILQEKYRLFKIDSGTNKRNNDSTKTNYIKLNYSKITEMEERAKNLQLDWVRGYGENKMVEHMTPKEIEKRLANEMLHREIDKAKRG